MGTVGEVGHVVDVGSGQRIGKAQCQGGPEGYSVNRGSGGKIGRLKIRRSSSNLQPTVRPRIARPHVVSLLRGFPALVVLGARQIGKPTLARQAFSDFGYVDLENPIDLARIESNPLFFLSQHEKLVIHEAQRLPALFSVLRGVLDAH